MTRTIFEALRESHERQRALYSALTEKQKTTLAACYQTDYDEAKATTV